ncbi:MAG: preprotein translocase subunit SecE [Clostridia bacterium]|nr:preprotein translocase subunit SecE [Clostridia bacterium]
MSDKSTKMEDKKIAKDTGKKVFSKKDSSKKKASPVKSVGKFIREYRSEIKKISWPSVKDTTRNAAITLAAIAVVGVFIWVLDFGLSEIRDLALENIPKWAAAAKADDVTSPSDMEVSLSDIAE